MLTKIQRFIADDHGATSIEYGLIISFLSILIVTSVTTIGSKVGSTFSGVSAVLK